MRLVITIFFISACLFSDMQAISQKFESYIRSTKPLESQELIQLVSGNSIIGKTTHSHAMYELYFEPSGLLYFRKNHSNKELYVGKWWVKDNNIFSHWPTYKKNINQLKFYQVADNDYILYNVNDSSGPKDTFGETFLVFPGDSFGLKNAAGTHTGM